MVSREYQKQLNPQTLAAGFAIIATLGPALTTNLISIADNGLPTISTFRITYMIHVKIPNN